MTFTIKKKIKEPPLKKKISRNSRQELKTSKSSKSTTNILFLGNKTGLYLNNKIQENDKPLKKISSLKKRKSQNIKKLQFKNLSPSSLYSSKSLIQNKWIEEFKSLKSYDFIKNDKLTEYELNKLKYEKAILKDKRTYLQYYYSLLKKKELIFFTFCPNDDYNSLPIKISLFLISLSLSFVINGFFFTDEAMHKIYIYKEASNITYRITEILYTALACGVIKIILKLLSLSENNILEIKHQNNFKNAITMSRNVKKCLKFKFFIYFLVSNIFLMFFWYFISCFCIVYNNCQFLLIIDSFCSIILSMLYPIAINILPGIFRIYALRAVDKNRKCLYKFSLFLALF